MNERNYNKQEIIDYLLGSLPEPQSERFDELSFTDDDFSNVLNAAENDLIDAYLNDELSGATLEKFKNHYLASPIRREKIEFAKSLQIYAAENHAQPDSENESFFKKTEKPGFFAFGNIFANPAFGWTSLAIVLILIIFAGFWFVKRNSNQTAYDLIAKQQTPTVSPTTVPQTEIPSAADANEKTVKNVNSSSPEKEATPKTPISTPSPTPKIKENTASSPVIASFVLSPPLRGAGSLPNVAFSKDTTVIKIGLKLEGDDYKTYRAALVDESNRQLWQSGNLKSANGLVNTGFAAKILKSGVYSLILSGVNARGEAEIIGNYSFRSVVK